MEYTIDPGFTVPVQPCGSMTPPPMAMAYAPMQPWGQLYEPEMGWSRGTIFPCLDKPFVGGACSNGMCL